MNKQRSSLAKNTLIYAIGNFGSKILAYVMVLVYSYYITPEELGYYDVVLTTISMVQPLVIFQINDGVFRFLIDSEKNRKAAIVGNVLKFLCMTTIGTICCLDRPSAIFNNVFCAFAGYCSRAGIKQGICSLRCPQQYCYACYGDHWAYGASYGCGSADYF